MSLHVGTCISDWTQENHFPQYKCSPKKGNRKEASNDPLL